MTEPILLERFYVKQIFGPKSHDVDLRFKTSERLTVLYGRNGGGKTIVLRLLDAIRWGQYGELLEIPFERMELHLSNGTGLVFEQKEGTSVSTSTRKLTIIIGTFTQSSTSSWEYTEVHRTHPVDEILRKGNNERADKDDTTEVLVYTSRLWLGAGQKKGRVAKSQEPDDIRIARESIPPTTLIETDRLTTQKVQSSEKLNVNPTVTVNSPQFMVEHLSQQVQREVADADRQYRQISARLDSSLVHRILQPKASPRTAEALQASAASLSELEGRLRTVGLLRDAPQPLPAHLDPNLLNMVDLILTDREEKLAPFRGLVDRAEALLTSLNAKLHPKSVSLDVDKGYELRTAADTPLPLRALSSGEQQWLVMLHELLFDVKPNTLVLIDDPEMSLHIEWQQTLLPELLRVAKANDLHFVLATHSPYIVGERDDLMVRVGPGPSP